MKGVRVEKSNPTIPQSLIEQFSNFDFSDIDPSQSFSAADQTGMPLYAIFPFRPETEAAE